MPVAGINILFGVYVYTCIFMTNQVSSFILLHPDHLLCVMKSLYLCGVHILCCCCFHKWI